MMGVSRANETPSEKRSTRSHRRHCKTRRRAIHDGQHGATKPQRRTKGAAVVDTVSVGRRLKAGDWDCWTTCSLRASLWPRGSVLTVVIAFRSLSKHDIWSPYSVTADVAAGSGSRGRSTSRQDRVGLRGLEETDHGYTERTEKAQ